MFLFCEELSFFFRVPRIGGSNVVLFFTTERFGKSYIRLQVAASPFPDLPHFSPATTARVVGKLQIVTAGCRARRREVWRDVRKCRAILPGPKQ